MQATRAAVQLLILCNIKPKGRDFELTVYRQKELGPAAGGGATATSPPQGLGAQPGPSCPPPTFPAPPSKPSAPFRGADPPQMGKLRRGGEQRLSPLLTSPCSALGGEEQQQTPEEESEGTRAGEHLSPAVGARGASVPVLGGCCGVTARLLRCG